MNNQRQQQTQQGGIDPQIIRFGVAIIILAGVIEVVDQFSSTAAWTLFLVLILGVLINNPAAIGLITLGGNLLSQGA